MTQPRRGSARTDVGDLRNIVDRLDVLMGTTATVGSRAAQSALGETLVALTERVDALEREAEELRTLVNHLMTIATWQAKVTATLVGEEAAVEDDEPDEAMRGSPSARSRSADGSAQAAPSGAGNRHGGVTGDPDRAAPARALDDDIDDILGTGQTTPVQDAAPPDFGI